MRVALARRTGQGPQGDAAPLSAVCAEPVRTGPAGIDPDHMAEQLVPAVRALLSGTGEPEARLAAVCVGAAGMVTLGDALRARLPGALAEAFAVRRIALAADAVTAYAGALGERPGAVVAAGTGMIAMGTDLRSWRRADGWGHLLGDCGSGAWIGRAGLEAAMRAHDGREGGSAALRARAEAVYGAPLNGLPGQLYPRTDRPAVLASFAPEVARCAGEDPIAAGILRAAAGEIAASAAAVCPTGRESHADSEQRGGGLAGENGGESAGEGGCDGAAEGGRDGEGADGRQGAGEARRRALNEVGVEDEGGAGVGVGAGVTVAFTGGLFQLGKALTGPLHAELARRLPRARVVEAAGDPLQGALLVASRLAEGRLALPVVPPLLTLVEDP
ncbi:BadF/BadG/BcrA/BcrD ATPase family protein [Streptomyces iconiensis]|uniref:BadF/BadG/BcrA/BcrD ATPase family protein n=2 Tax=Streptomyces iconiensis TaxID=1384038 RepID=A0ABT7A7G4_9ACTN|nr:BadF/BadG/BcrA/BcrD ATPase family protein [Streptomyces iconiensis]MDJ1137256.1 BadF/BadG/BcrA/BcrD ATPase family protein [Streptomyces iconiensis]